MVRCRDFCSRRLLPDFCGFSDAENYARIAAKQQSLPSGWNDAHAHIHSLWRMRQQTHRDEIDASLGVGADILQANSAGAFHRDVTAALLKFGLRAALNRAAHIV